MHIHVADHALQSRVPAAGSSPVTAYLPALLTMQHLRVVGLVLANLAGLFSVPAGQGKGWKPPNAGFTSPQVAPVGKGPVGAGEGGGTTTDGDGEGLEAGASEGDGEATPGVAAGLGDGLGAVAGEGLAVAAGDGLAVAAGDGLGWVGVGEGDGMMGDDVGVCDELGDGEGGGAICGIEGQQTHGSCVLAKLCRIVLPVCHCDSQPAVLAHSPTGKLTLVLMLHAEG